MNDAEWRDAALPQISLRGSQGDGLTIQLRRISAWSADYSTVAAGDVVTIAGGAQKRLKNVLMGTDEVAEFGRFLRRAVDQPKTDWTLSVFDDGMTLRVEGDGTDRWRVDCRSVPLPGPGETWETFPSFGFTLTKQAIEGAISELAELSSQLDSLNRKPPR